jgi:hypothetical protein
MFAVPTSESRSQVRDVLRRTADLFALLFGTRIGILVAQSLSTGSLAGGWTGEHFSDTLIMVMIVYIIIPVNIKPSEWARRLAFLLIFSTIVSAIHSAW